MQKKAYFFTLLSFQLAILLACNTQPSTPSNSSTVQQLNPFNDFPPLSLPLYFGSNMLQQLPQRPTISPTFAQQYLGIEQANQHLHAVGRLTLADTATVLVYGETPPQQAHVLKMCILNQQQQVVLTYIVARQQKDYLISATLNRHAAITSARHPNRSPNDSTVFQTYQIGEPIYTLPIDTIAIGKLDNDRQADFAYIIPPIMSAPYPENPDFVVCDPEPCQLQIQFSNKNITPLFHPNAIAAQVHLLPDLNNDHIAELLLVDGKKWNSWNNLFLYSYVNKKWNMLDSIKTFNLYSNLNQHVLYTDFSSCTLVGEKYNTKTGLFDIQSKHIALKK